MALGVKDRNIVTFFWRIVVPYIERNRWDVSIYFGRNCGASVFSFFSGGTLGLFAGISLISIVEAAYCLVLTAFRVARVLFGPGSQAKF